MNFFCTQKQGLKWIIYGLALPFLGCEQEQTGQAGFEADVFLEEIESWEIKNPDRIPDPRFSGVLSDSSLVIIDNSLHTINHLDPEGNRINTFGGEGRGPGEFSDITHAAVHPAGFVAVADLGNARFTIRNVFDGSMITEDLDAGWHTRLTWVEDKLVITNNPFRIGASDPGDVIMRVYDPGNGAKEEFMHLELELTDPPFEQISCTFCEFKFLDDLSFFTSPQDTSYRVFRVSPDDGKEVLFARPGLPAVEYTEEEQDELREQRERQHQMTGIRFDNPLPTHKRRFIDFFVDHKNRLWALLHSRQGEPLQFDIFSYEGEYIGSLNAPENMESVEFVWKDQILFRFPSDDPDVWKGGLYRIAEL